ncbi:hypothetical protein DFH08DRAFT_934589 [Mycena albidolilacea]|uniref:Uncharacterized protein n=1 Tax=Mycena albidolilacea TaxID=1033008 RepID=A0AAD7A9D2_9AGAR|nr:hypothetical protein DFH08DRAFT_934589 [Mycena albidolilacea]
MEHYARNGAQPLWTACRWELFLSVIFRLGRLMVAVDQEPSLPQLYFFPGPSLAVGLLIVVRQPTTHTRSNAGRVARSIEALRDRRDGVGGQARASGGDVWIGGNGARVHRIVPDTQWAAPKRRSTYGEPDACIHGAPLGYVSAPSSGCGYSHAGWLWSIAVQRGWSKEDEGGLRAVMCPIWTAGAATGSGDVFGRAKAMVGM